MLLERFLTIVIAAAGLMTGSMETAMPDKDIDGTLFLVNRQHALSEKYVPAPIRTTETVGMSQQMRDDAALALEQLFEGARADGIRLSTVSGYRSYSKQSTIYARKVKNTGSEKEADRLVARPGTSEHQLALAMDLSTRNDSSLSARFGETPEGKWVYANAHKYGFIVRYPLGYEDITGYDYEPWHIRYVGIPHAEAIFRSGLPMETYMSHYKLELYDYLIQLTTNEVLP
ncbi:MAG: D-alanyl-D-alanine carboxypeptidase family protein [Clostridiales bacterium]|nr:D-alanyl-D-alanine carboxypeptidase family protein [Clostridiales bacterium]